MLTQNGQPVSCDLSTPARLRHLILERLPGAGPR
jgi:hypothetical protein